MRKWGVVLLVCVTLLGACRGDSDDKAAPAASSTSTTAPTRVEGFVVDAPTTTTAAPNASATTVKPATTATTSATTRTESNGATVTDAPREAHTETTDNGGDLTYGPNPRASSSATDKPNDPLTFVIACQVAADGHGTCHFRLVNNVARPAQFPGGLKIVIHMQRKGGTASDFEHLLANVTTLKPGEEARVDATFDLTEPGDYTYNATTTVAWP